VFSKGHVLVRASSEPWGLHVQVGTIGNTPRPAT
jgi:hypothetical protein